MMMVVMVAMPSTHPQANTRTMMMVMVVADLERHLSQADSLLCRGFGEPRVVDLALTGSKICVIAMLRSINPSYRPSSSSWNPRLRCES
jgi:hypothetical protein